MKAEIKDGKLIVTLEMNSEPMPSKSGKTLVIATTHGNQPSTVQVKGQVLTIGVNAYIRPPAA